MEMNETAKLPPAAPAVSPYVGPRPFIIGERDRFFGRAREIDELTALVISNPMVLFYAQSGAGKSSLVNAGLLPEIEKEDFEALPPVRVGLPASEIPDGVQNIFAFNALNQWCSRPVINPDDDLRAAMPTPSIAAMATMTLTDYLASRPRSTDDYEIPMPRVVIFDQFEEIFRTYPERWREREPFFKQVRAMLDADPLLRVVFVMREDYIAELDPYAPLLPDKLRVRFRLELLRREAALSAVQEPLKDTSVTFAPGVAAKLVDDLLAILVNDSGETVAGEFVEPVYLQVVCENLWNEVRRQGLTEITESGLQEFGSVSRALSNFYENCLVSVVSASRIEENTIRKWFETELITPDKTRNRVRRSDKDESTAGLSNFAVDRLEDLHIVRGELQNDARWYELAHDRMIEPIVRSNERARLTAAYVEVQQQSATLSSADALSEITQILAPLFEAVPERPAILAEVFVERAPQLLSMSMDYNDTSSAFASGLLRRLITFGRLSDGSTALQVLTQAMGARLPDDRRARLAELVPIAQSISDAATAAPPNTEAGKLAPLEAEQDDRSAARAATERATGARSAHLYIIYARADREFFRRLSNELRAHRITIWNDATSVLSAFNEWDQATADALRDSYAVLLIASPAARRAESVRRDIENARVNLKRIISVWADGDNWVDAAPPGFGGIQYIDARGSNYANARSQLTAILLGLQTTGGTGAIAPEITVRNPYKGLRAFTTEDAGDFFGRDTAINEMIETLRRYPQLLAVIGPSGAGKSSAVRAGLIPRLKAGALTGSRDWIYAPPFTPGDHPIENVIASLSAALPNLGADRLRQTISDSFLTAKLLREVVYDGLKTRMVLVVDQFEEIFTQSSDGERDHTIDLLHAVADETNASVTVLLILRADFFDQVLTNPVLSGLATRHSYVLRAMTTGELREAIEKPAALAGLVLESGLVEQVLVDLGEEPGALPLLQFTLDALYQLRDGRRLTLTAYKNIGGVRGALAQHAETAYGLLRPEEQQIAQTLFLRLIEVGSNGEAVRRRITKDELSMVDADQTAIMRRVAEEFIDAHLLFVDTVGSTETLTLSHEALIETWERLQGWITERGGDLQIGSRIRSDAAEWNARNRPIDTLYRGETLAQAQEWLERSSEASPLQRQFIEAGGLEQQRREQEARDAARRVQRLRQSSVALAIVGVSALILVVLSLIQAQTAEQSRAEAQTQIAQAQAAQATAQGQLALVDTQVAQRNAALTPVQLTLAAAMQQATENAATAQVSGTEVAAELQQLIDVSTARRFVAAANSVLSQPNGNAETAALLAIRAARLAALPEVSAALNNAVDRLYTVEIYPDGLPIAFPSGTPLPDVVRTADPLISEYAFNPVDGSLFIGRSDGGLRRIDAATGEPLFIFTGRHDAAITSMTISPDGRLLATGAADGALRLWDSASGLLIRSFIGHDTGIFALTFTRDRQYLISGGGDQTARVWETGTGDLRRMLTGHVTPIVRLTTNENSDILSLAADGSVRRWTLALIERPASIDTAFACSRVFRDLTREERSLFGASETPTCPVFGGVVQTLAPTATATPTQTPSPSPTPTPLPTSTARLMVLPIQSIQVVYGEDEDEQGADGGERQIVVRLGSTLPQTTVYNVLVTEQDTGRVVFDDQLLAFGNLLIITVDVFAEQVYLLELVSVNLSGQPLARADVVIDMETLQVAQPTNTPTPKTDETSLLTPTPSATSSLGTQTTTATRVVVVGLVLEAARLRTGPGLEYSLINTVPAGESVTLRAVTEDGAWFQVERSSGESGWIAARLVASGGDLSQLEYVAPFTATPTPTLAPTAAPEPSGIAGVGAQRGMLTAASGAIWLYNGQAGEALTVRVNSTEFDTTVWLYDEQGMVIAFNDDTTGFGGAPTTNSRFDIFLPSNGIYRIEVRSYQDEGGGAYVLALESDRTICGDAMCSSNETADSCPLDCGS